MERILVTYALFGTVMIIIIISSNIKLCIKNATVLSIILGFSILSYNYIQVAREHINISYDVLKVINNNSDVNAITESLYSLGYGAVRCSEKEDRSITISLYYKDDNSERHISFKGKDNGYEIDKEF